RHLSRQLLVSGEGAADDARRPRKPLGTFVSPLGAAGADNGRFSGCRQWPRRNRADRHARASRVGRHPRHVHQRGARVCGPPSASEPHVAQRICMSEINIRSDSVDVEQIMRQIRARIREKRGVDYTEEEIRELAAVKLEKFLDPRGVRSDLLEQFRRSRAAQPEVPNFAFEDSTLYDSHRLPWLGWLRRMLNPILKLFFNPNPVIHALHI